MRRPACLLLAAAASLSATWPAFATTSASAVIRSFRVTLEDLDPFDGIAPLITFQGGADPHFSSLYTLAVPTAPGSPDAKSLQGPAWGSSSLHPEVSNASAGASIGDATDALGRGWFWRSSL